MNFLALLKFGSEKDLTDLYENGTIYLNTLQYFNNLEDNGLRGDNYEGILQVINYTSGKFDILQGGKPFLKDLNYRSIHLRQSYPNLVGNVYSLFGLRPMHLANQKDFLFDPRLKLFGSHFVMILNDGIQEFFDKIFDWLAKMNIRYGSGFINYYNKFMVNGSITLFMKPDNYAYQNEFRIYTEYKMNEPISFKIGSIKHIAKMFPSDILDNMTIHNSLFD